MATQFDRLRTIGRMAPKTQATAAVFQDGHKLAFGVVVNMSITGACIVTDRRLVEGHNMTLKLSLYKQPELFEIPARIVWVRKAGARELGVGGCSSTASSSRNQARPSKPGFTPSSAGTPSSTCSARRPSSTFFRASSRWS